VPNAEVHRDGLPSSAVFACYAANVSAGVWERIASTRTSKMPTMNQRVLVTGASGFIGQSCIRRFADRGYEVCAISSTRTGADEPGIRWLQADLLDQAQIADVVAAARADTLLHLAWIVKHGEFYTSVENFSWVASSVELVKQFVGGGGQRVVVAGTCYEYDQRYGWFHEQRTPTEPNTIYGVCKNALRQLLAVYCRSVDVSFAWARLFFLYGRREHPNRLVSSVIRSLLNGESAKCSHGRQFRDYLYVDDLADALVALCESDVRNEINVASGEPVTIAHLVTRIGELMELPELIELGALPSRPAEAPMIGADTTYLRESLGWRPRHSLDDALRETIEWWQGQTQDAGGASLKRDPVRSR
jgi:nucleoside-diphosphate-sugar epimerase